jgi:transcriptional regulator with XRE-family HTH domain
MSDFAQSLRRWRRTRRLSQLDLAGDAGLSARHLSFLETGRARPSRMMVDRLALALALPGEVHNQLLTQAGYSMRYGLRSLGDEAMQPIRKAIDHMLSGHEPFPGLAIDRLWRVVAMNRPARAIFAPFGVEEGSSLLDMMGNPALPAMVENWPEVALATAQRLRTESLAQGGVPDFDTLAETLSRGLTPVSPSGPVIPTVLRRGADRLSLFATLAQFGTPGDITLEDLKIELYFPADAATEELLRVMAGPEENVPDRDGTARSAR